MASADIDLGSVEQAVAFSGSLDKYLKAIENGFGVTVTGRGQTITINGDEADVDMALSACRQILGVLSRNGTLDDQTVDYAIGMTKAGEGTAVEQLSGDCIMITSRGKPIKPKTVGQKRFVESIKKNSIVFGIGPAGTGKTYLSVVMAVNALKSKEVSRLILTRPAVEAGEKLGFLPGDLQTKIDPYLRPLYDALFDTMGAEVFQKNVERGIIEVAPLAYMRGRTLDDAFIILDEAQNTTSEQMKMFLTRLGNGSKMVVNGDVTQIDLPDGKKSGLIEAIRILSDIEGIDILRFTNRDIVRNRLVCAIVNAYEKKSSKDQEKQKEGKRGRK